MNQENVTHLYSKGDLVEWRDMDADAYTIGGLIPKIPYKGVITMGSPYKTSRGYILDVKDGVATVLVQFKMVPRVYKDLYSTQISLTEFKAVPLPEPKKADYPLIMFKLIEKQALK